MVRLRWAASLGVVCSLVLGASAYYLPGTYPREFAAGQHVQGAMRPTCSCNLPFVMTLRCPEHHRRAVVYQFLVPAADVNSLISPETELPFDYYSMPFCWPPEGIRSSMGSINPGTILMGSRIENSPYNFSVKVGTGSQTVMTPTCRCLSCHHVHYRERRTNSQLDSAVHCEQPWHRLMRRRRQSASQLGMQRHSQQTRQR